MAVPAGPRRPDRGFLPRFAPAPPPWGWEKTGHDLVRAPLGSGWERIVRIWERGYIEHLFAVTSAG